MSRYEDEEESIIEDERNGLISKEEMKKRLSRLYWNSMEDKHVSCDCMACLPWTY